MTDPIRIEAILKQLEDPEDLSEVALRGRVAGYLLGC
jgi:hypothetical protein